jgi:transposase
MCVGKRNDAADAAGICEAVTRPSMRSVGMRTLENQATLMHHKARGMRVATAPERPLLAASRPVSTPQTHALINALRGHLAEIGNVAAQGFKGARELAHVILAEGDADRRALPTGLAIAQGHRSYCNPGRDESAFMAFSSGRE